MATQIAAELFTCTSMEEVHRLATRLRAVGRRSVVALNEEHRIEGGATRSRSDRAGPSSVVGDGPASSVGFEAEPSTSVPASVSDGDGLFNFTGMGPSTSPNAPSDRPSIDDYTVITEDVDALISHDLQFITPTAPPSRLIPSLVPYVRRKKMRRINQPEITTSPVQLEEPLSPTRGIEPPCQPTEPPTLPQMSELSFQPMERPTEPPLVQRRRNPERAKKIPSCGTN